MINKYNSSHYATKRASFHVILNQKILVCLDSEASLVYAFSGEKSDSYHITLEDTRTWYAFVAGNSDRGLSKMALNLGFEPFENKLPEGFSPWIFGIDGINLIKRNQYLCTKRCPNNISFLAVSISLLFC